MGDLTLLRLSLINFISKSFSVSPSESITFFGGFSQEEGSVNLLKAPSSSSML